MFTSIPSEHYEQAYQKWKENERKKRLYAEHRENCSKSDSYNLEGTEEEVFLSIGKYHGLIDSNVSSYEDIKEYVNLFICDIHNTDEYPEYLKYIGFNYRESKEYKELFSKYIEFGKKEKLFPESMNTPEEFVAHKNLAIVLSRYSVANYKKPND
jgi:hypothetical protein